MQVNSYENCLKTTMPIKKVMYFACFYAKWSGAL